MGTGVIARQAGRILKSSSNEILLVSQQHLER